MVRQQWRVLVTAGPTRERIDPVRFLSNDSSGRLGYAIARVVARRGGRVTLVSGPTGLRPPAGVEFVAVESAREMMQACHRVVRRADLIIMAAAVADYRPVRALRQKHKKSASGRWRLELVANPDILAALGQRRRVGQWLVGFALETARLIPRAQRKLRAKRCDLIVANGPDAIGHRQQRVTLVWADGRVEPWPAQSKSRLASRLVARLWTVMTEQGEQS